MTDRRPDTPTAPRARRARRRKPSPYPVVAGSLAAFMGLFGFMAYQLRIGHDPALGNKAAAAPAPVTKRVVLKRIEDHIIITKLLPPEGEDGGGNAVAVAAVPATTSAPAGSAPVVQSTPVVVRSAPAPAPAPAPVATRTS